MSHRLTFGSIKAKVARILNFAPTDPRVIEFVNRACETLLYKGKWVGTYGRYVVCAYDGCLTWPREIETIEAAAICSSPVVLRNGWFEFLESGPGIMAGTTRGRALSVDRGDAVAFDEVTGTGKKIAVYCDATESGEILLRYWNKYGQKVYTGLADNRIEGEIITLPAAGEYAYTSEEVMPGGLYGVIKPVTERVIRLWEYTVATAALKPLAFYEPDETLPCYRRSLFPSLAGQTYDPTACVARVTVVGKLRFIPAVDDNSYLPIQHPEAIVKACQSIFKSDANAAESVRYMYGIKDSSTGRMVDGAVPLLEEQLQHWQGSGFVQPIRIVGQETWGMVENVI